MLTLFTLTGCGRSDADEAPDRQVHEDETSGATDHIEIPATVRRNIGITFATVERRRVADTLRVPGSFELQPLARHEYRIMLPGRIEFLASQYQEVEPGTPLYRYRSPQWPELQHEMILGEQAVATARAEIDVAQAKLAEARERLDAVRKRIDALAAADFRAADLEAQAAELEASLPRLEAELLRARTSLVNGERTSEQAIHRAAAAIGMSESVLKEMVEHEGRQEPRYRVIDWIEVQATAPGIVEAFAVTHGGYIEPPSLVLSTVDPMKLRFRAMGLQSDISRFTGDLPARIVPPQSPGFDLDEGIDAELAMGLEAHPDQRTITLIATPSELRPWMRPGVSAFLEIVVEGGNGPALAIPKSAIVKDGITHVFFRRDPKNPDHAIRVRADLGVDDGRWVVANSGVRLGDEVVLNGAYELQLAMAQAGGAPRGGHMHPDGTFHADH
jgi:multidrug efflux pump subunit AcrA (membrane-fusion protein)